MKQLLLILLLFTVLSCSKTGSDSLVGSDTKAPTLTIIAPAKGDIYRTGDPLCFKGDVIDDNTLNRVKLKFFKASDMNNPVLVYEYPVNERSFYVDQKTIITSALSGQCVLQFEATDYNNNRAVTNLSFSAN